MGLLTRQYKWRQQHLNQQPLNSYPFQFVTSQFKFQNFHLLQATISQRSSKLRMKIFSNRCVWCNKHTELNASRFTSLCRFRKESISSTAESEVIVKHNNDLTDKQIHLENLGTLMQIWKFPYIFVFIKPYSYWNFCSINTKTTRVICSWGLWIF